MKTKFGNQELMHHWAHHPLDDISNAGGSLYTLDGVLYSYGSHYKMAKQFRVSSGPGLEGSTTVVLFNENSYSNTTAKQRGQAMSACSHMTLIMVPNVDPDSQADHAANVDWLAGQVAEAIGRHGRARLHKDWAARDAVRYRTNLTEYAHYFGIELDPAIMDQFGGLDVLLEQAAEADRVANEAREAVLSDDLRDWQQCKREQYPAGAHSVAPRLRVHNNELQTSHGIRVSLTDDVIRELMQVWRMVQTYKTGGYGECTYKMFPHKVGTWCMDKLEKVEDRVYLVAGCHRMAYPQLRRVARMLGLPMTPTGYKLEAVG
jgi:hypothetical protein